MLDKLYKAFALLKKDVSGLRAEVERISKVKPVARDGRDGKDGVSPDPEALVTDVLAKIPAPKDGRDGRDGKDGKDGDSPSVTDVAAVVLSKIPTPKDGKDGVSPDPKAIAKEVSAQVPTPRNGRDGKDGRKGDKGDRGPKGEPGRDGKSITDVKLRNNDLIVSIDGKPRNVGAIRMPAPESFTPGAGGGGSSSTAKTIGYTPQGTFVSPDLQAGVLDTPQTVTFGAGGTTDDGGAVIGADGVITVNDAGFWSVKQRFRAGRTGASGVSILFFWAEISVDGGTNWSIIGNSVSIPLDSSNDTSIFFDIANIQVPAGTKLRNRFARSSTGDDSGDLRVGVPSAALQAAGVPDAPSAQATFYKINQ